MKLEDYSPDEDLILKCIDTIIENADASIIFYIEDDEVKVSINADKNMEVVLRIAMFDYLSGPIE